METALQIVAVVVGLVLLALIKPLVRQWRARTRHRGPKRAMSINCRNKAAVGVHAPWPKGRCICKACKGARVKGSISTLDFCWCIPCRTQFNFMRLTK